MLLALDRRGALRFAPLGGVTFGALFPPEQRERLPDSLVLRTPDGRCLVRSSAVREALRLAGGPGRALARLVSVLPPPVADRVYDRVAQVRRRLFRPPRGACPAGDPARRERFLP
jgi:predicted DCC family thiol-disulfide oxidoreductase YuxK